MGNPVNMYYIGSELLTHYNANVHNFHLETNEMWNFEERFSIINQYSVFSLNEKMLKNGIEQKQIIQIIA